MTLSYSLAKQHDLHHVLPLFCLSRFPSGPSRSLCLYMTIYRKSVNLYYFHAQAWSNEVCSVAKSFPLACKKIALNGKDTVNQKKLRLSGTFAAELQEGCSDCHFEGSELLVPAYLGGNELYRLEKQSIVFNLVFRKTGSQLCSRHPAGVKQTGRTRRLNRPNMSAATKLQRSHRHLWNDEPCGLGSTWVQRRSAMHASGCCASEVP